MGAIVLAKKIQMRGNPLLVRIAKDFSISMGFKYANECERLYFRDVFCEYPIVSSQP